MQNVTAQQGDGKTPEEVRLHEFFEAKIRPVLVANCYECHNSTGTAEGGLAVDHREALRQGGDGGAVVVPGEPQQSRLLATLRHEIEGLEMPQGGAKLDAQVIADFEQWITHGAVDPRDAAPSADELAAATSWDVVLEQRKQWWSFQPIRAVEVPEVAEPRWSRNPIDRFVYGRLRQANLTPAEPARPEILVRRLYVNLIGLPPSTDESQHWTQRLADAPAGEARGAVVGELVDQLLLSPRFGERWARHWMDWIRYAESHGSEGDPEIANAWVYRDYLIRALNADVPLDQLVREHIAGDLMAEPRRNLELGINESAIGPAHLRMVFHGFAPTDALDEKVRFIDDQINAVSKAFLGVTVSCARCHDHKFDAISQEDYYALFGIFGSCRPGRTTIDLPTRLDRHRRELAELKPRIRQAIAADWLADVERLRQQIIDRSAVSDQPVDAQSVLYPLTLARKNGDDSSVSSWETQAAEFQHQRQEEQGSGEFAKAWHLGDEADCATWYKHGVGLEQKPQRAGHFAIAASGDTALVGIYPGGTYSHGISAKHAARLTSRDVPLPPDSELWVRVIGDGGSMVRYVVQDYPRDGTVYPVASISNQWVWQRFDVSYWSGDQVHLELTTANDAPLLVRNQPRSWFGVRRALLRHKDQAAPKDWPEHLVPIFDAAAQSPPTSFDQLVTLHVDTIADAIRAWTRGEMSDSQALLLDACLRQGLIGNQFDELSTAQPLLQRYRQLEDEIPVPTRVPGVDESEGRDQELFVRGNHRVLGDVVPRRFLEAIDATAYQTEQSGRMQLADDLLSDQNPLTRRVLVNRVWHHLFGQGIVSTPDNFGRLGDMPSHPELLDWLAIHFEQDGWSLRQLVRRIVTSQTWQLDSQPSTDARERDPENRLLSHANVRRMEAEAIRDSLLMVSGQLRNELGGAPVDGKVARRSVYVQVRRNSLDPFLRAFDFPEPFSCEGRRAVTNVPAQSLTMLNDPQIAKYAESWAEQLLAVDPQAGSVPADSLRIDRMIRTALGRGADQNEADRCLQFLASTRLQLETQRQERATLERELAERRDRIESLKSPVRDQLLSLQKQQTGAAGFAPVPIARWEFDGSGEDLVGDLHLQLHGGATFADGALLVKEGGYAVTAPLAVGVKQKTLEAWVQLDQLTQQGGGVMTLQTLDGQYFDAIVFGEQAPQHWLAGSNGFARTKPFFGTPEEDADRHPVHIAIAYHADGRIKAYRNGVPYGESYQSDGPLTVEAQQAVISFGVRHLPAGGNRMLAGRIFRAQLYDHALSDEEIAASSGASPGFVPDALVIQALTEEQRATVMQATAEITAREARLQEMGDVSDRVSEVMVWSELARAIFTLKEFTYVR
jgi:hypothetical protein